MINIRFPNIKGTTETEQLREIKSYLHQLVEQLNWALSTLEASNTGGSNARESKDPMR